MLQKLRENRNGIIGVWVMAIIAILVGSMVWGPVVLALSIFGDKIILSPYAPINEHGIINAVLNNAAIVEVVIIIGPLAWAFASSFRKERQEY